MRTKDLSYEDHGGKWKKPGETIASKPGSTVFAAAAKVENDRKKT